MGQPVGTNSMLFRAPYAGSRADNTAMEDFFGLLKREQLKGCYSRTRAEDRADIFDHIERLNKPIRGCQFETANRGISS